jgi:hypothetical protein
MPPPRPVLCQELAPPVRVPPVRPRGPAPPQNPIPPSRPIPPRKPVFRPRRVARGRCPGAAVPGPGRAARAVRPRRRFGARRRAGRPDGGRARRPGVRRGRCCQGPWCVTSRCAVCRSAGLPVGPRDGRGRPVPGAAGVPRRSLRRRARSPEGCRPVPPGSVPLWSVAVPVCSVAVPLWSVAVLSVRPEAGFPDPAGAPRPAAPPGTPGARRGGLAGPGPCRPARRPPARRRGPRCRGLPTGGESPDTAQPPRMSAKSTPEP